MTKYAIAGNSTAGEVNKDPNDATTDSAGFSVEKLYKDGSPAFICFINIEVTDIPRWCKEEAELVPRPSLYSPKINTLL